MEFVEATGDVRFSIPHIQPSWNKLSIPALIELLAPEEPDAFSSVPVELAISQIKRMIADTERDILVA
jgi:hypothetical protein